MLKTTVASFKGRPKPMKKTRGENRNEFDNWMKIGGDKLVKSQNSAESKFAKAMLLPRIISEPRLYLVPKAKLTFIKLRRAFTVAMIQHYFDLEHYIFIETDVSGYVMAGFTISWHWINIFLNQMKILLGLPIVMQLSDTLEPFFLGNNSCRHLIRDTWWGITGYHWSFRKLLPLLERLQIWGLSTYRS